MWVVVAQFGVVNAAFTGAIAILGPAIADRTFGRAVWGLVLARVYSYDALDSFAAVPVGEALIDPVARRLGTQATLLICGTAVALTTAAALTQCGVRALRT